jgi:AcrR family transcriptional regulator
MPRQTLTRAQIVEAAIELLDADGVDGLSMRRLGTRLGSAATAVYWHVQSKDNLVVLAGAAVWAEIDLPDPRAVGWRSAATTLASGLYAMVSRHAWLVPAMGTHLIYGPAKARHDEHCLTVYEAAGFTGADADAAMSTVFLFVLGRALVDAAERAWRRRVRRDGGDPEAQLQHVIKEAHDVAAEFPRLRARLEALGDTDPSALPDRGFEFGLQTILDGLEAQLAARP